MPTKYEPKSAELVVSTAETLKNVAEQLAQVAAEMEQHGMKEALFPWTQRQWDCLDLIITLSNQCAAVLPSQVVAKQQKRPSQYETMQKKSQRDIAARKARLATSQPELSKPKRAVVAANSRKM